MSHTGHYDALSRLLMGPFFTSIAADVARVAPAGTRVLEVGCGPGHLAVRLARDHGLAVNAVDLDPAMIERARANAAAMITDEQRRPTFEIADVGALPFADGSFDLVVSTLSLHHWSDPTAGLAEIARVLRPGARALVWDLRQGGLPLHGHVPDPVTHGRGAGLRVIGVRPWRWPWIFSFAQRVELAREF